MSWWWKHAACGPRQSWAIGAPHGHQRPTFKPSLPSTWFHTSRWTPLRRRGGEESAAAARRVGSAGDSGTISYTLAHTGGAYKIRHVSFLKGSRVVHARTVGGSLDLVCNIDAARSLDLHGGVGHHPTWGCVRRLVVLQRAHGRHGAGRRTSERHPSRSRPSAGRRRCRESPLVAPSLQVRRDQGRGGGGRLVPGPHPCHELASGSSRLQPGCGQQAKVGRMLVTVDGRLLGTMWESGLAHRATAACPLHWLDGGTGACKA